MDQVSNALQDPLAQLLEDRLMAWKKARDPQEEKMLECYYDVMRIARDGDTSGTGVAKAKKSKGLFMGSTRNKVRSARAKINDALFGNGKLPFDTNPVNEKLAPYADVVEDIIKEQLERGKFKARYKAGTNTLATYGTGFMIGPLVRKEKITETFVDSSLGVPVLKEKVYEYDFPYFELAATLDCYPDPEAHDMRRATGFFWVSMECPDTIRSWKGQPGFKNIEEACLVPEGTGQVEGSERARQMRGNADFWHEKGRIRVARYFGKVPKSKLKEDQEASQTDEEVGIVAIMAGGVVVKVEESPWGEKKPVLPCVYEAADHEIWGVGVAENNMPHQKTVNAAFRLFNEGKGIALNPPISVDRSKFLPSESFKFAPGKVYDFKPGLNPDDRKNAVMVHVMPDVSSGWRELLEVSEQFSDDDTAINKYTQGNDSSNLNKTAHGISMIMSASSLPIKEVIQNIDEMWIEQEIEALIEWNLKYLEPETVQKIHGDEHAQIWAQIKEFGKTSFIEWQATGTSSFMQKEVLTSKLQAFTNLALSNPLAAQETDVRELLEQTWDMLEIGGESPIKKDEDQQGIPPQIQQQIQQMEQALQNAAEEVEKLEGKEAIELEKLKIEAYKAETERMQALAPAFDPAQVQAMVMQTLQDVLTQNAPIELPVGMPLDQPVEQAIQEVQPDMTQAPPPEMQQPIEQPSEDGFFTPEDPQGMQ